MNLTEVAAKLDSQLDLACKKFEKIFFDCEGVSLAIKNDQGAFDSKYQVS